MGILARERWEVDLRHSTMKQLLHWMRSAGFAVAASVWLVVVVNTFALGVFLVFPLLLINAIIKPTGKRETRIRRRFSR
jgi:hypothetical protein